jgi:site-specific recombinase XerD
VRLDLGTSLTGWDSVMTGLGDVEVLVRALDLLGGELASSSRQRAPSTLRGFCGYLVRRGLLTANPCDAPELSVRAESGVVVHAFTRDDVDQLIAAAAAPPPSNVRSAWPTRDVAIVDVLAHCGLRVGELTGLIVSDVDRRGDSPLLRLTTGAKGGKRRTVPIPHATLIHIDRYLIERTAIDDERLKIGDRAPLFVRHNGTTLTQQFVDSLLRRLTASCGITAPEGAMAHALRHSYGMELALRGVPLPVIQQLLGHSDPRTSSIYTIAHATDLTDTLRDAGLL